MSIESQAEREAKLKIIRQLPLKGHDHVDLEIEEFDLLVSEIDRLTVALDRQRDLIFKMAEKLVQYMP